MRRHVTCIRAWPNAAFQVQLGPGGSLQARARRALKVSSVMRQPCEAGVPKAIEPGRAWAQLSSGGSLQARARRALG